MTTYHRQVRGFACTYMLDTGVDISHPDFQNTRIEWDWAEDVKMEMTDDDVPGHCLQVAHWE